MADFKVLDDDWYNFTSVSEAESMTYSQPCVVSVKDTGRVYQFDPASTAVRDGIRVLTPAGGGRLLMTAPVMTDAEVAAAIRTATTSQSGLMSAEQYALIFNAAGEPRQSSLVMSSTFQSTGETSFQNITGMTFPIAANEKVVIQGVIFVYTVSTVDYKLSINGPDFPSSVKMDFWHFGSGYTATGIVTHDVIQTYDSPTRYDATSDNYRVIHFNGAIINGSNAGTVAMRLAKNAAGPGAAPIVQTGSFVNISRL